METDFENDYESEMQRRLANFDAKRPRDKDLSLNEKLLLIKAEILGEIVTIKKNNLAPDTDNQIAMCIYIECRQRGMTPDEAEQETIRQMNQRKKP